MRIYRSIKGGRFFLFLLLFSICPILAYSITSDKKTNLIRERGAIYLEDFSDNKIELLALKQVPIYVSPQKKRSIGQLKKGKSVTLIATKEDQFLIRGMALHGQVKGWIPSLALQKLDKKFSDNLLLLSKRKKIVDALITKQQIALGMKTEEVIASMGKPDRKSSKLNRTGRSDTYEYSTYERIAQFRYRRDGLGNLFKQKYYVKTETGKLSVNFKNDIVESIEETEGEPLGGENVKIVPVPIKLF